ncbi:hypothetical protein ACTXT7_000575 [Hymenolepis weldensis]
MLLDSKGSNKFIQAIKAQSIEHSTKELNNTESQNCAIQARCAWPHIKQVVGKYEEDLTESHEINEDKME